MQYDFTEAVLARPKMYTLEGSYPEVVAFLEGYYSGLAKSRSASTKVENWSSFRQWLAQQLDVPTANELKALADRYGSTSLEIFSRFYQEFKASTLYIRA